MAKRKRIKIVLLLGLVVSIAIFGMTAQQIIRQQSEYAEARDEYDNLRRRVAADIGDCGRGTEDYQEEGINFDALFAINPRTVGWITLPDSTISYPIVQGNDNRHYLHHTFGGRRNASGAIFLDYRDPSDFSGRAKIYGHNMRDGSMFSTLRAWEGDTFIIHTPNEMMEFVVTWRGVLPLRDIVAIRDDVALITCVNGRPDVRFVIRAERRISCQTTQ